MQAARKRSKKTQEQIADELGTTQPQVWKWEHDGSVPQPAVWRDVAAAYGIPADDFIAAAIKAAERLARAKAS